MCSQNLPCTTRLILQLLHHFSWYSNFSNFLCFVKYLCWRSCCFLDTLVNARQHNIPLIVDLKELHNSKREVRFCNKYNKCIAPMLDSNLCLCMCLELPKSWSVFGEVPFHFCFPEREWGSEGGRGDAERKRPSGWVIRLVDQFYIR